MDQLPIGVFDTGLGGLSCVREMNICMPGEDIIYFGDTARVPYGSKSKETVTKFSLQIVDFLIKKNVKAVIIACNTASSNSFEEIKNACPLPMVEVIKPGARLCAEKGAASVGVIATEATVRTGLYEKYLKESIPGVKVYSKACPLFVPLVEEGWVRNSVARLTAEVYLQEMLDYGIDSLVLGCTHYPLLIECIKDVAGGVAVINPAEAVAREMKGLLAENGMESGKASSTNHVFYVSDDTSKFNRICRTVFGRDYDASIVSAFAD